MTDNVALKVAKYYWCKASFDGDLITPLKMQKLLYYAYVWTLIRNNKYLFQEKFQAWVNGPVLPSVYQELKRFKYSPIDDRFLKDLDQEEIKQQLVTVFGDSVVETLDKVYEEYIVKSAFELSAMTHNERPWSKAREGLGNSDVSEKELEDRDIIEEYGGQT